KDASGKLWEYPPPSKRIGSVLSGVAVANGVVYFHDSEPSSILYALDATRGQQLKTVPTHPASGAISGPPVSNGPPAPAIGQGIGQWDGTTALRVLPTPYAYTNQSRIPFGHYSYYLIPWRNSCDTWSVFRLLDSIGVVLTVRSTEANQVCKQLAD